MKYEIYIQERKKSQKFCKKAIAEYEKRLSRYCKISCKFVKKEKEWKKKATVYEEKLDNCIKSHNITDFDATSGAQWNREDIKEQLKDCHLRIKNGESDFE